MRKQRMEKKTAMTAISTLELLSPEAMANTGLIRIA
jgi:hypothetical protein